MKKPIVLILVALLAIFFTSAGADEEKVKPAGFNLHGKTYFGFINLDSELGTPAFPSANTDALLPTYIVWGQSGTTLYGALVIPSEDPNVPPGSPTNIILKHYGIVEGKVDGNKIEFNMSDEELRIEGAKAAGDILDGGKKINVYVDFPFFPFEIGDIFLCNEDKRLSGFYLGPMTAKSVSPSAKVNNMGVGILIEGTKMTFTLYAYFLDKPNEPYVFSGVATFKPGNNTFTFDGNPAQGEPDANGSIKDNKMKINATFPGGSKASATLYFFEDKKNKKPVFRIPKPKKIKAGQETKVRIKHKNGLKGSLVTVAPSGGVSASGAGDVKITRYEYIGKFMDVWFDVAAGAGGTWYATLVRPDGKEARAKKPVKIIK